MLFSGNSRKTAHSISPQIPANIHVIVLEHDVVSRASARSIRMLRAKLHAIAPLCQAVLDTDVSQRDVSEDVSGVKDRHIDVSDRHIGRDGVRNGKNGSEKNVPDKNVPDKNGSDKHEEKANKSIIQKKSILPISFRKKSILLVKTIENERGTRTAITRHGINIFNKEISTT